MDYNGWVDAGKPTAYGNSEKKAMEILENHKVKPLDQDKADKIRKIIEDAEDEKGVTGYWKGREEKRFDGSGEVKS
jgi:trimethylamine:corrinoid methyltransferase-like protein